MLNLIKIIIILVLTGSVLILVIKTFFNELLKFRTGIFLARERQLRENIMFFQKVVHKELDYFFKDEGKHK